MADLNKVLLIGRLTRDPELRYTGSGTPVSNFSIAVNSGFGKSDDNKVDFINIVAWNKTAELCNQYLEKGKQVMVEGRLQIRSYQTQEGQKRTTAEVVANFVQFLGKAGDAKDYSKPKSEDIDQDLDTNEEFFDNSNFDEDDIPF